MSKKNETDLNKYKKEGKVLKPPFAQIQISTSSWINQRMPDLLWTILIVSQLDREKALDFFRYSMRHIEGKKNLYDITLSGIGNFPEKECGAFIKHLLNYERAPIPYILKPMLLYEKLPALQYWKEAINQQPDPNKDWKIISEALKKCLWHQSQEATDCRWVKVLAEVVSGNLIINPESIRKILLYPTEGDQREVRPMIRATEIVPRNETASLWPMHFWNESFEKTQCIPEQAANREIEIRHTNLQQELEHTRKNYLDETIKARHALIDHFFETISTTAIDARHQGVFGLALFGLETSIENNFYRTGLSVNGRVMLRVLFETYITLAYLIKKEKEQPKVWDDYRSHGSGQANLIYRKFEENNYASSTVDKETIERIANEDKWVEFVPINLGHWDSSDLRKLSEYVGEKQLYDQYYAYTSGFVHGSWAAVRESVFQKCFNPLHRLHLLPTFDLPLMSSVTKDMMDLTNKLLSLVGVAYPSFDIQISKADSPKEERNDPK